MVKGYVKVRKFAIPMRFKSLHPRMQSIWGDEPKDEHGTYTNMATGTIDCEITVLRFQSFGAQNQVDTLPEISLHLTVSVNKEERC